jgi:hypothetical protein
VTEAPTYAPEPKFVAGDRVEVNMPVYSRGVIVGEPTWHPSGQWQYEIEFEKGRSKFKWTENRLDRIGNSDPA